MEQDNIVDFKDATVLITGGTQGIGLGLAERFLARGSSVIVTGRDLRRIDHTIHALPGLHGWVSDISSPEDRISLAQRIESEFPAINIVINNAGIQRRISLASDSAAWSERQIEIDTLLSGPIHLNSLLIPVMLKSTKPGMIVNVTSGGAFYPSSLRARLQCVQGCNA